MPVLQLPSPMPGRKPPLSVFVTTSVEEFKKEDDITFYKIVTKARACDEQKQIVAWRRFNQFHSLKTSLPEVTQDLDFPSKKLINNKKLSVKRQSQFHEFLRSTLDELQRKGDPESLTLLAKFLKLEYSDLTVAEETDFEEDIKTEENPRTPPQKSPKNSAKKSAQKTPSPHTPPQKNTPLSIETASESESQSPMVVTPPPAVTTPASAHKFAPLVPSTPVGAKLKFFLSHLQCGFIVKKTDSNGKTRPVVMYCDTETASFVYYRKLVEKDFESKNDFNMFISENFKDGAKNKPVKRTSPLALVDLKSVNATKNSMMLNFINNSKKEFTKR